VATKQDNELSEGFKMTKLGPLPEEWDIRRLGDVAFFETGKRMRGGALEIGEVLSLGGEHIGDFGNLNLSNPKYISRQFFKDLRKGRLCAGDVIICKDGAKTGKVAYIQSINGIDMAVNEHLFIIRSNCSATLLNQFIFFFMFSDFGQYQVREAYHGLIGGITNSDISSFMISLPPLPEQRAIAHVISIIQRAIKAQDKLIIAVRELKKSLIGHLFTYGPVPLSEAEHVPLKETEIGPMPENWEVLKIGDLLRRGIVGEIQDGNHGEKHPKQQDFGGKGVPFITANCVRSGKVSFKEVKFLSEDWLSRLRIGFSKPGDVLLTHKGTIGETSILQNTYPVVILSPQVTYYRIKGEEILDPTYLFAAFQTSSFQNQLKALASTQSTRAYIGITKQATLLIPFPHYIMTLPHFIVQHRLEFSRFC